MRGRNFDLTKKLNEETKEKEKIVEEYRGSIIHYSTQIEKVIDDIILSFFIKKERQEDFFHALLGYEFLLGKKITLITFIIKNYYPLPSSPNVFKILEDFLTLRNHAAHRYFNSSHPSNKDKTSLVLHTYKTSKSTIKTEPFKI